MKIPARSPYLHLAPLLLLLAGLTLCPALALAQEPEPEPLPPQEEPLPEPTSTPEQEPEPKDVSEPNATPRSPEEAPPLRELSPEERFDQDFGALAQRAREETTAKRATQTNLDRDYFLVDDDKATPQLDYSKPIVCLVRDEGAPWLHLQCDHATRQCLVAEDAVFRDRRPDEEGRSRRVPTQMSTARTTFCNATLPAEDSITRLNERGYTLTAARLEAPYGYKRDERGRAFQSYFDLRSRLLLGVYYAGMITPDGAQNTMTIETRSTYEAYKHSRARRHKFRFIEGEFTLAPFEARGMIFDYGRGRSGDEPLLYLTELIGEPSRHDIYLNIGAGLTLGRVDYRGRQPIVVNGEEVDPSLLFIDLVEGRMQWELLQGTQLEDYVMLTLGAGVGTRAQARGLYVYPELGFRAALLTSPRGLFQLTAEGRMRYAYEAQTLTGWLAATAAFDAEWVALAISDQPISLYVRPSADFLELSQGPGQLRDFKAVAGIRISLFTPTPDDPGHDSLYNGVY